MNPDNFWPDSGYADLAIDPQGALVPTEAYLARLLTRPELALVPESCPAETALHRALQAEPGRPVAPGELAALQDDDARENYRLFLRFRDRLVAAGSLQAFYLQLMRQGAVDVPPVLIDLLVQGIVRHLLDDTGDAWLARAGEMLFRPQRLAQHNDRWLAGDRETLDPLHETAGWGELGRWLQQGGATLQGPQLPVLSVDNAADYWRDPGRHRFLLDLTPTLKQDLGHGLVLNLTPARSGLKALAQVLQRWVGHLLGVQVQIEPVPSISDPAWRWHVGLDVESTAILNDLYQDRPVEAERMARLVSLFTLTFANPAEMRADVAGKPVYLGLATNAEGLVRIKPQNLLLNLPLATAS